MCDLVHVQSKGGHVYAYHSVGVSHSNNLLVWWSVTEWFVQRFKTVFWLGPWWKEKFRKCFKFWTCSTAQVLWSNQSITMIDMVDSLIFCMYMLRHRRICDDISTFLNLCRCFPSVQQTESIKCDLEYCMREERSYLLKLQKSHLPYWNNYYVQVCHVK